MKHLSVTIVDGVIKGISEAPLDPLESRKAIDAELEHAEEQAPYKAAVEELSKTVREQNDVAQKIRSMLAAFGRSRNIAARDELEARWKELEQLKKTQGDTIHVAHSKLQKKRVALRDTHAVYSAPRNGKLVTDLEAADIHQKLSELGDGDVLTEDLKVITAEEAETQRVSTLDDVERSREFDKLKDDLMQKSIGLRQRLEIQGDEDALGKAKEFYDKELLKLEKRYYGKNGP